MTRSELISQLQKIPAFKGFTTDEIETYIDLGLEAVSAYQPKKVKLLGVPSSARLEKGYPVPSAALTLLQAFVAGSAIQLDLNMFEDATPPGGKYYTVGSVQVPSYINLIEEPVGVEFDRPVVLLGQRPASLGGAVEAHDLVYTVGLSVEDLDPRSLFALRLYAEGEAYDTQSSMSSNSSDLVDREPSGASTTIRRSQSSSSYQKLADRRKMSFRKEIIRPYGTRDGYGIIEMLWSQGAY